MRNCVPDVNYSFTWPSYNNIPNFSKKSLESRIDLIEQVVTSLDRSLDDYMIVHNQRYDKFKKRIDELEEKIKRLESLTGHDKKPQKCPVCEGKGRSFYTIFEQGTLYSSYREKTCLSCEGKGIVWG